MKHSPQFDPADEERRNLGGIMALAAAVLAGVVLVGWVLGRCRSGIDFTDEGFYLNWISNPSIYRAAAMQFGFIYHPLYELVGGNIALLRQINTIITLGLAWQFGFVLLRTLEQKSGQTASARWQPVAGVAFVLSTCTLAYLDPWLPTPSYDSLALQALLLGGTGVLWADSAPSRKSVFGWGLIGFSGWLAFMAKPTTAIAWAIVVAIYVLVSGKFMARLLAIAVLTAGILGLLSAWAISGSVGGFIERLALGAQDFALLKSGHTMAEIWRLDEYSLAPGEKAALAVMTGLVFLGSLLGGSRWRIGRAGAVAVTGVFAGTCIWAVAGTAFPSWASTPFRGLVYWAIPYGACLGALALVRGNVVRLVSRRNLALALCLVALPHVCTFGSNGNYWWWGPRAAIFWVLAGLPLLAEGRRNGYLWPAALPMAAATLPITASLLFLSMAAPYRQPQPLWQDQEVVRLAVTGSRLRVAREVAAYIQDLDRLARNGGFQAGDPMVDLTGQSAGALYAIGAKAIGRPWMNGGRPGSDEVAARALGRVPLPELRKAWVLWAPSGPVRLSSEILKRYGLDVATDYQDLGVVRFPKGHLPHAVEQHLLRPLHPATRSAP